MTASSRSSGGNAHRTSPRPDRSKNELASFIRYSKYRASALAILPAGVALALSASPRSAMAAETEVTANSAAQVYSVNSPFGSLSLARRRFTQTLGLGVYHLEGQGTKPGDAEWNFNARFRLDSDAGIAGAETTFQSSAVDDLRFVPGLQANRLELMYGYLEGKRLAGGWLGFRLGRQQVSNSLGWWGYDGAMVRVTTPFFVQIEAYGGLEQRGGFPLSTSRYERGGVWRGDRAGFVGTNRTDIYPEFLQARIAPAYGVALESAGPTWIHGRLDYRKVLNTGDFGAGVLGTTNLPTNVTRTSSERIGYAMDLTAGKLGGSRGAWCTTSSTATPRATTATSMCSRDLA